MNSGSHRETAGSYSTSLVFKAKVPVSMQQQHSRLIDDDNNNKRRATEQQEQNKTRDCCCLFAAGETTTKVNTSVVVSVCCDWALLLVVRGRFCWSLPEPMGAPLPKSIKL